MMSPSKQFHVPTNIAAPVGDGYSHAVSAGGVIYVAGQIGMDPSGAIPESCEAQARRAFENLRIVLTAAGAELSDVVKATVLLVDRDDLTAYRAVRQEFLPHRPASTLMIVRSLAMPELRFEIEAIAVPG
jgi:2-iminobutanoate/2-iminopropanoate deaminase